MLPIKSFKISRCIFAKIKAENYISKYNIDLIHSFGYRADRISQKLTLPVLSSIRIILMMNIYLDTTLSSVIFIISHIQIIKKCQCGCMLL